MIIDDGNTSHAPESTQLNHKSITKSGLQNECTPHQNLNGVLHGNEKNYPKIHIEAQKTSDSQSRRIVKSIVRGVTIADSRLHCRVIVTKPAWNWHQNRRINQWNRKLRNKHNYSHLILEKMPKHALEKRQPVQQVTPGKADSHIERRKLDPHLILDKVSSTRIRGLSVKVNGLKLLRGHTQKMLQETGIGKDFLKRAPATQEIKPTTNK